MTNCNIYEAAGEDIRTVGKRNVKKFFTFFAAFLPVIVGTSLEAQEQAFPQLTFSQEHDDGMYKTGDRVTFTIRADGKTDLWKEGKLHVALKQDLLTVIGEKEIDLSRDNPATVSASFTRPGFITLDVTYVNGSFVHRYWTSCGAGADPEKIQAASKIPSDLLEFWRGEYEKFKKDVPANVEVTPIKDSPHFKRYHVTANHLGGGKVYAALAIPKNRKGPFPLMLTVLPAGNWGVNCWEYPGMIRLTISVFDHLFPTHEDYLKEYREYYFKGADKGRKEFFYYKPILGALRMIDYAKTIPEWDGKNLFAVGQSQGGAFSLIMAALCPEITAAVADVPGFCDHHGEEAGHMPGGHQLLRSFPDFSEDANYFDTANFAAFVKCPVLMSAGMIDDICPPASVYSAYNRIKGEKSIYTDPLTGHGTGRKKRLFQMMPLDQFLRDQISRTK